MVLFPSGLLTEILYVFFFPLLPCKTSILIPYHTNEKDHQLEGPWVLNYGGASLKHLCSSSTWVTLHQRIVPTRNETFCACIKTLSFGMFLAMKLPVHLLGIYTHAAAHLSTSHCLYFTSVCARACVRFKQATSHEPRVSSCAPVRVQALRAYRILQDNQETWPHAWKTCFSSVH